MPKQKGFLTWDPPSPYWTPYPGTKIFEMPRFKELIERWGGHALNMWLGMYGAPTWKMVKLFSSDPFIYRLFRTELCSCFQMFWKLFSTISWTSYLIFLVIKHIPFFFATCMYENGIHHPWFRCPWAPQIFNIVWGSHPVMFAGSWTNLNSRSPALLSATQMAKGKRSLKAARCWRQRKCIPRPLAMQCLGGDHVRSTTHGIGFYMYPKGIYREPTVLITVNLYKINLGIRHFHNLGIQPHVRMIWFPYSLGFLTRKKHFKV